jgi:hypothetical protein
MNLLAASTYLANKPDGGVLICLVVALVLLVLAAALAGFFRAFWACLVCGGLFFFVLAFMLK